MRNASAWLIMLATGLTGCAQLPADSPIVVACANPVHSTRPGPALVGQSYGMAMTPLPLNSVQFGSPEVARALAIQGLYAQRSPSDTVQVTARFVSCEGMPTSIRVRTAFLRADTAPAEPVSAWKKVYLEPRATAVYTEYSTARDVGHYLIEVAQ